MFDKPTGKLYVKVKKILTKMYKYVKIFNCNPLSQGSKKL